MTPPSPAPDHRPSLPAALNPPNPTERPPDHQFACPCPAGRKRAIRELMARHHPRLKVTLATADALAILGWALRGAGP